MATEATVAMAEEKRAPPLWHSLAVWGALLVLTALTFGLSRIDMGSWSIVVALAIAITKALLVMVFFMHILHEHGAARLTMAVAVLLVLSLAVLAIADGKTRFPPSLAGELPALPAVWRQTEMSHGAAVPPTPLERNMMRPAKAGASH